MIALLPFAALRGTVILTLAWLATALLRRASADVRHRIWTAALFSMTLFLIPWSVPEAAQVKVFYTTSASAGSTQAVGWSWQPVWWFGAACFAMHFLFRLASLAWITARATRTEDPQVRVSNAISTPMTWGVLRPVILLPDYAADWSVALQHERAHIARADWFFQSCAMLLRAIFWFHPLVWLAVARMRAEAEHAVDDAVLAAGVPASNYAEQLLHVAHRMNSGSNALAVSMVRRPKLTARVALILDASRRRTRASAGTRAAIAAMTIALIPAMGALRSGVLESLAVRSAPVGAWTPAPAPQPSVTLMAQATPAPKPAQAPAPQTKEPYTIGDGVTAPVAIVTTQPAYTEEARAAKWQGQVMIRLVVNEEGVPTQMVVTQPLGLGLDEQALLAVSQWRFKPGTKNGVPVPVIANIAVQFHLL